MTLTSLTPYLSPEICGEQSLHAMAKYINSISGDSLETAYTCNTDVRM